MSAGCRRADQRRIAFACQVRDLGDQKAAKIPEPSAVFAHHQVGSSICDAFVLPACSSACNLIISNSSRGLVVVVVVVVVVEEVVVVVAA